MGEPSHHQQSFEFRSPQDPKSSQLLVCAHDLLGAVRVDATQDPFALHFTPNHTQTHTHTHLHAHVLRTPCRISPWRAEQGRDKVTHFGSFLPWHGVPPTRVPCWSPWSQPGLWGHQAKGKEDVELVSVVSALHRGACSPRVLPGQTGPIQPAS